MKSAVVITPSIGHERYLAKCVQSVENQDYENLHHLVVIDGPQYFNQVMNGVVIDNKKSRLQVTCAPENTGGVAPGYYGHRIYAAYPHLVNADYVFFLDEDNWWEPNHVSSLIELCEKEKYDWAFSLRNIYTQDEQFLDPDCCESIGMWPIFWSRNGNPQYLVDTSSYCFRRDWLITVCQHWHSGWGGDRRFFSMVRGHVDTFGMRRLFYTSGLHTLNYRLDSAPEKKYGSIDFFKIGNAKILSDYREYPWKRT